MLVKTYAAAVHGINAIVVTVETVVSKGVQYCIGLPMICQSPFPYWWAPNSSRLPNLAGT